MNRIQTHIQVLDYCDKVSDSDCQLDIDAVIELAYSGEESESEVRNTVFQKL
jgi:hypothetical protein